MVYSRSSSALFLWALTLVTVSACERGFTLNPPAEVPANTPILLYDSATQKCVTDVPSAIISVVQTECLDEAENFTIVPVAERTYTVKTVDGTKCLEIADSSTANGAYARFAPCTGAPNQWVTFRNSNLDYLFYKIVFAHSGKCLDVFEQQRQDGAALIQWDCHAGASQDFLLSTRKTQAPTLPKMIWTFWDKGASQMPDFYKANVVHWKNVLAKGLDNEWEIKVLNAIVGDPDYFGNYVDVSSIPTASFIASKIGNEPFESRLNPAVIFADFLRLELLYKYGGVWMDPSIMLHSDFNYLRTPLEVLDGFTMASYTTRHQGTYELRFTDSLENFFIVSLPNTDLLKAWKDNFRLYWNLKQPGMSIADNPLLNGSMGVKIDVSNFADLANYLNQHIMLKYTLITQPNLLKQVFLFGGTGLEEKGPFSLLQLVNWDDQALFALTPTEIDLVLVKLENVAMSKFPSENSRAIRQKPYEYFFDADNIFGRLNAQ